MKETYWGTRIEANRAALIDAIKTAYRGQITTDPTSGYTVRVVLWDDDTISQQECVGNSTYYAGEREDRALCVATINGQRPEDWQEWLDQENGDEAAAAATIMDMALTDWDWDPESYIDEALEGLKRAE